MAKWGRGRWEENKATSKLYEAPKGKVGTGHMEENRATSNLCGTHAHAQLPSFIKVLLHHSEGQADKEKFLNRSMFLVEAWGQCASPD